MPSREIRRALKRKDDKTETIVEKKRQSHPAIYAFSVVILVIIVVTFIGAPAIKSSGSISKLQFGTYKDKPIEFYQGNFFSQQKDLLAEQLRQSGANEDLEIQAYKVWRGAFDQTVFHIALLVEAEQAGIWISEDRIDKALVHSGPYLVDGAFNEERFRNTPSAERFTTRKLFRERLTQEQVLLDIFTAGRTSDRERDMFKDMARLERRFSFVRFPFNEYPQAELIDYARSHLERFKKIKLSRILIKSSEKEAVEIHRKLTVEKGNFEELARAHSKDLYAEKGGDVGFRYFYDLESEFDTVEPVQKVFALSEGELSAVLKNRFGWVIYRCDSATVQPDPNDENALKDVKEYVLKYERGMVEDHFRKKADEFIELARKAGFLNACGALGLKGQETEFFPINYQGIFFQAPVRGKGEQADLTAAMFSQDFFIQAFSLPPQAVSQPILLEDQILVLKMEGERTMSEAMQAMMNQYARYFDNQALQTDIQNILMDPKYLKDDFNTVFYEYIFPKNR